VKARTATTLGGEALPVAAVQPMSGRRESLPSAGERVPSMLAAAAGVEAMPRLSGTVAERVLLAAQLHWLSFVQSLFFGTLFVAAVWVLHADAWVGTPKEMLTILLMAFGFDWTSESLLSATKKLKPD
jgi:hypothetical protein